METSHGNGSPSIITLVAKQYNVFLIVVFKYGVLSETTEDLKLNHWNAVNSEQSIFIVAEKRRVDSFVGVEN